MKVTLDKAGRVVLPKSLREALHLSAGDSLELAIVGEEITLHPQRSAAPLRKERGVWVFRTGDRLSETESHATLRRLREERIRSKARDST